MVYYLFILFSLGAMYSFADDSYFDKRRDQVQGDYDREQIRLQQDRVVDEVQAKKRQAARLQEQRLEDARVSRQAIDRKLEADRVERARLDAARRR